MAARKKQEVSLQAEINVQEEWEDILQKEGLLVVDVYQEWCGPCKAMSGFFRRVKNETADDLLNFAVAKADSIDSLERYRGNCEPCFLIYGGGALVGVCRGANPPILEKLIKQKLAEEHKCLSGEMERLEIRDPFFAKMDEDEKKMLEELAEREDEVELEITVALIKPDAVQNGKVDSIIAELEKRGIKILAHEERRLTEEEARQFYSHITSEPYFENMVKYLTSDMSHILVLAKDDEGIISEFRDLIGPADVDEAKEKAPESLRALYGTASYQNAIHAPDSKESAVKELAFFFPDFQVPKTKKQKVKEEEKPQIERTLALIRPDAVSDFKEAILQKIHEAGFSIVMQREKQFTRLQMENFYASHKTTPYYNTLMDSMTKGPTLILALARQDAVNTWKRMLGPKDPKRAKEETPEALRAQFQKEDLNINLLHGSEDKETAEKELNYFFPVEKTVAVIKPDAHENKEEILERIKEAGFQIEAIKEAQLTEEMACELYKDVADKDFYHELVRHMISGVSTCLVLSREDAVQGFRAMMGEPSPEVAAEKNVESLRAIYGKTIKENAIHASSSAEQAKRTEALLFTPEDYYVNGEAPPTRHDEPRMPPGPVEDSALDGIIASDERVVLEAESAQSPRKFDGDIAQVEQQSAAMKAYEEEAERVHQTPPPETAAAPEGQEVDNSQPVAAEEHATHEANAHNDEIEKKESRPTSGKDLGEHNETTPQETSSPRETTAGNEENSEPGVST